MGGLCGLIVFGVGISCHFKESDSVSEQDNLHDVPPVVPVRTSTLAPGRSNLEDRLFLTRFRRRRLIREIEARTQRVLLCYVSEDPPIDREDVLHLHALLYRVEPGTSITLLLNSPGGDVDAADKLQHMLRESVSPPASRQSGDVEIVVPNEAKSAATIMALGADRVTMSDASELGPIDPQVKIRGDWYPVAAWLTAYEEAEQRCRVDPGNLAFAATLEQFPLPLIATLRLTESRTGQLAGRG